MPRPPPRRSRTKRRPRAKKPARPPNTPRAGARKSERVVACLSAGAAPGGTLRFVPGDEGGGDAAAHVEDALDGGATGMNRRYQIVQDAVGDRLVEGTVVAERPEVQLPRLQFDAQLVGDVLD